MVVGQNGEMLLTLMVVHSVAEEYTPRGTRPSLLSAQTAIGLGLVELLSTSAALLAACLYTERTPARGVKAII